jgi:hypothetical protein
MNGARLDAAAISFSMEVMKSRWFRILLLTTFLFWSMGAARVAHEMLEHGEHAECHSARNDADATADRVELGSPDRHGGDHSHEHCVVCQTLAAMTVDQAAIPVLPNHHVQRFETLRLTQLAARTVFVAWLYPSRGPPAVTFTA